MIRGLIFDINGTVIDILTNEYYDDIYRVMSNLLSYQGISLSPDDVHRFFFDNNRRQRKNSPEKYPEFDAVTIFRELIGLYATDYTRGLPETKLEMLPGLLAEVFRAASRFKLQLYPDVLPVLDSLRERYRLSAVSDGQSLWAVPELHAVGLLNYFDPVVVSSDLGFRKPDERIFESVLAETGLTPSEVLFIGNDMYRDVFGASQLGIKTVFFKSNQGEQRKMGAEPDYIIYNFSELPEAVRFLTAQEKP